ncbi:hypothetical protein PsYK624_147320 [Phanerochaete sordida]|uniref:Uncharacterized protein n=1 Tax=Phanerochaete sordida TaxID=48140 RepID=A0A9P3LKM4_9APHY|nr:hypothetical protein PsYK624_147320 [Phanerochaete sordida]
MVDKKADGPPGDRAKKAAAAPKKGDDKPKVAAPRKSDDKPKAAARAPAAPRGSTDDAATTESAEELRSRISVLHRRVKALEEDNLRLRNNREADKVTERTVREELREERDAANRKLWAAEQELIQVRRERDRADMDRYLAQPEPASDTPGASAPSKNLTTPAPTSARPARRDAMEVDDGAQPARESELDDYDADPLEPEDSSPPPEARTGLPLARWRAEQKNIKKRNDARRDAVVVPLSPWDEALSRGRHTAKQRTKDQLLGPLSAPPKNRTSDAFAQWGHYEWHHMQFLRDERARRAAQGVPPGAPWPVFDPFTVPSCPTPPPGVERQAAPRGLPQRPSETAGRGYGDRTRRGFGYSASRGTDEASLMSMRPQAGAPRPRWTPSAENQGMVVGHTFFEGVRSRGRSTQSRHSTSATTPGAPPPVSRPTPSADAYEPGLDFLRKDPANAEPITNTEQLRPPATPEEVDRLCAEATRPGRIVAYEAWGRFINTINTQVPRHPLRDHAASIQWQKPAWYAEYKKQQHESRVVDAYRRQLELEQRTKELEERLRQAEERASHASSAPGETQERTNTGTETATASTTASTVDKDGDETMPEAGNEQVEKGRLDEQPATLSHPSPPSAPPRMRRPFLDEWMQYLEENPSYSVPGIVRDATTHVPPRPQLSGMLTMASLVPPDTSDEDTVLFIEHLITVHFVSAPLVRVRPFTSTTRYSGRLDDIDAISTFVLRLSDASLAHDSSVALVEVEEVATWASSIQPNVPTRIGFPLTTTPANDASKTSGPEELIDYD